MKLAKRRLRLPVINSSKLRVAQLSAVPSIQGAKAFAPERWPMLQSFGPNVLAGSVSELKRLIERIEMRTVAPIAPDHSLFVVIQLGDTPLTPRFRDQLWRPFSIPVYEIYTDGRGALLAYECEAQEGWHVERDVRFSSEYGELLLLRGMRAVRTGLNWIPERTPCGCGREGIRLLQPKAARLPALISAESESRVA